MKNKKIAIIGCGNLGQSILQGLLDDKYPAEHITVTKRNTTTLAEYEKSGVKISSDNVEALKTSEIIIVALKPYNILSILEELKPHLDGNKHVLVSLASGVSIAQISDALDVQLSIFRAMPNIAADVNESITCISSNGSESSQMNLVKELFDTIGTTIIIEEELMEAATVLGACGIAYVLRFIRAMVQGGIQIGFSAEIAGQIVNQTVRGAAQLLIERKEHPEFEIDKVTTPKGCTIVGLNEMEHNGFSSALIKGLVASYDKIES
ncbi:MAG: pyrroline-5-carboxylate reductase [Patiriisocius sp.]|jgi:pyrroline-5-carboxylate reductase